MSEKARVSAHAAFRVQRWAAHVGQEVNSDPSGDLKERRMWRGLALLSAELRTNNRAGASHVALRHQHQRTGGALQANAPSCYHKRKGEPGPQGV